MNAIDKQVGGKHYKGFAMQPVEVAALANLNFYQGSILKYVMRYKEKDGIRDLKKAIHYAELGNTFKPKNTATKLYAMTFIEKNKLDSKQGDLVNAIFNQHWSIIIVAVKQLIVEEIRVLTEEIIK